MSSLLGHLESPEKKERNHPSTSTAVSVASTLSLPPGLLSESSRDSIMARDVSHTRLMLWNTIQHLSRSLSFDWRTVGHMIFNRYTIAWRAFWYYSP